MFENVYTNPIAKGQEGKVEEMIKILYNYYLDHIDKLPEYLKKMMYEGETKERVVCDYVSSMTDRYAVSVFEDSFISVVILSIISRFSLAILYSFQLRTVM